MDTQIQNIPRVARGAVLNTVGALILYAQLAAPAFAGNADIAERMHNRIAGVPASATVLQQMTTLVAASNFVGAALLATDNPNFYNVTLKNFVTPC